MAKPILFKSSALFACLFLLGCQGSTEGVLVKDQESFQDAVASAQPGDVITLANGTWEDFEILFTGEGTEDAPIRLTVETKGEVILTGQSNLRLAGEYLEVSGLVFKDGYTPTQEVVSFRKNKNTLANNSRVTEIVIDNFNQPERQEADFWVMMYGKNNRFDHNHLVGKRNKGVTMAVRLNSEDSQENYHRIDHNYFGPRSILGSNGGETLRIGTSHYSMTNSHTIVEDNYFDRCDGELEIISSKSGKNIIRNNTFFESRGTLTMRHGNDTLVEGNVFFGNGVDHTGGIRVINARQTVRNNYMEGLTGSRFGGALVVMNGVPNSPVNRYQQVVDSVIEGNTLINSDNIQLAAGSDQERSAVPIDTTFKNNLIYSDKGEDVFTVYDDVSGIDFDGNVVAAGMKPEFSSGFNEREFGVVKSASGLSFPAGVEGAGVSADLSVVQKDETGASWYPKTEPNIAFGSGKEISIEPGDGVLSKAIKQASPGDIISLAPGNYVAQKFLKLDKPLTFSGSEDVKISFERSAMFEILNGGSLRLENLEINGDDSPDYKGNSVIRTSPYAMIENYRLEISNVDFVNLDTNHSFNILSAAKGTFADHITVESSSFENITGAVFKLDKEDDDYGIYNAEYLTITDSSFKDIGGDLVDFYRGGRDESTFGPHFNMTGSELDNVGHNSRNASGSSLLLHGVQVTNINDNTFTNSAPFVINHTVGEPKTKIVSNRFENVAPPKVEELNSILENTAVIEGNQGLTP
jgi:poly(beta-D-mannuronate) lyase